MKWFLSDLECSFKIKRLGAFAPMEYPSPLKVLVTQPRRTLCDPMDCSLPGSAVHGDSPGKNTGVGCHSLLQGIFMTQGLNLALRIVGRFFAIWVTREAHGISFKEIPFKESLSFEDLGKLAINAVFTRELIQYSSEFLVWSFDNWSHFIDVRAII